MAPGRYIYVLAALGGLAFAQAQSGGAPTRDQTVIRMEVDLVNLLCTVRDKSGAYVSNLSQDDFIVTEDGQPRPITHFAGQTDSPLTVALLLDVSFRMRNNFEKETEAARQFFRDVLRPDDSALLASFGGDITLWQDLTSSQQSLNVALDKLGPSHLNRPIQGTGPGPVMVEIRCLGSRLYDVVYLASSERLKQQTGRKAIVVLTDGDDCGSAHALKEATQAAQQSDVIIYGIHYDGGQGFGLQILRELSEATGGRTFQVDKKMPLETIFAAIEAEIRNQYAIGYAPPDTNKKGAFHKVKIQLTKPGLIVQSRDGYFR